MDDRYLKFLPIGSPFYGREERRTRPARDYGLPIYLDWSEWVIHEIETWTIVSPRGHELPPQGWKIHCSATLASAPDVLEGVAEVCAARRIPFKFAPGPAALASQNGKLAPRTASGKFVTVYPSDETQLVSVLDELVHELIHLEGPGILGDLRWSDDAPVFLRFGGFRERYVDDPDTQGARGASDASHGDPFFDPCADRPRLLAVEAPDGTLVPDVRSPSFAPPSWVPLPKAVAERMRQVRDADTGDLAEYDVTGAIRFSAAGGLYRATRRDTGAPVILKEARPFTGLDPDGDDAVTRLRREEEVIRALSHVEGVVRLENAFESGRHRFLSLHAAPGRTVNRHLHSRNPFLRASSTVRDRIAYRDEADRLFDLVQQTLESIHRAGFVHGDVHPENILVSPEGQTTLIDFESAHAIDARVPPSPQGVPGFSAAPCVTGPARDAHAVAAMRLSALLPLTFIHHLDGSKAALHLSVAREKFELSESRTQQIDAHLTPLHPIIRPPRAGTGPDISHLFAGLSRGDLAAFDEVRELLSTSIVASAEPTNGERWYPGDIDQFGAKRIGLAHGVTGVLRALGAAGHDDRGARAWLSGELPDPSLRTGLMSGLAGALVAGGTDEPGLRARVLRADPFECGVDLFGGASGVGLALLSQAREPNDAERELLTAIAHRARRVSDTRSADASRVGLLRGASGVAVFLAAFAERFDDSLAAEEAERLVTSDLDRCRLLPDDSLQVDDGTRVLPYLGSGSTGIGLAALAVLRVCQSPRLRAALPAIERAASTAFTINSGLFSGRAGLMQFLAELIASGHASDTASKTLREHAGALGLHAIRHGGGIAFPGEQLLRLSSDWGTGTAGVLSALTATRAALTGDLASLPSFLPGNPLRATSR